MLSSLGDILHGLLLLEGNGEITDSITHELHTAQAQGERLTSCSVLFAWALEEFLVRDHLRVT